MSADYSQIEMRVVAHMSNDTRMIDLFQKGGAVTLRDPTPVLHHHPLNIIIISSSSHHPYRYILLLLTSSHLTSPYLSTVGDIYIRLASVIMNKDVSMVVDEERNKAKVVCLGTTLRVG